MKKNKLSRFVGILLVLLMLAFVCSCDKSTDSPPPPPAQTVIAVPTVSTSEISDITPLSAQCGGTVSKDNALPILARGVCWSTSETPTIEDSTTEDSSGIGVFISTLNGLASGTKYFVRAYATDSLGTGYGSAFTFNTAIYDIDSNMYPTVTIGSKVWMAENLRVVHYRNGDSIFEAPDAAVWYGLTSGAYCYYDNDPEDAETYGRLYNSFIVIDPRNVAPAGWHVPTKAEWQALIDSLGGTDVAGGDLKERGLAHWAGVNAGATNSSGFSALPSGQRWGFSATSCGYDGRGISAYFWVAQTGSECERALFLNNHSTRAVFDCAPEQFGFSIRCVKD